MRVPESTLETLEFDAVAEMCARRCATPIGRELASGMVPFPDAESAGGALAETAEAREHLDEAGRPSIGLSAHPRRALSRLAIAGVTLAPDEVGEIVALCSAVEAARRALAGAEARPLLAARARGLPELRALVAAIEPHLGPAGEILDSASRELRRLRRRAASLSERARRALERILDRSGSDQFLSDRFITERGGRHVIPVRTDAASAPKGIVHGVSSSGASVFLEPLETVDLNNEFVRAREEESAEVERILLEWTGRLAGRREDLEAAAEGIGAIDFIFARALLARDQRAMRPLLGATGGLLLDGARHPVLERTLASKGGEVVPLTLTLEPDERVLVISGPNTGGKTVALKTVGLLTLMAHSGLHVPAVRFEVPSLRQLQADIGDHQSIAASLSTFSSHISNIASILDTLDPPALVLLDEVGTGTDPAEGAALAAALLERLIERGALAVVTTHHGALKTWAYSTPGVGNAAVEFDEENLRPTYRLRSGVAGASAGLAIAKRLGLDGGVIEAARARLDPDARETEALLRRLREMLASAERDREQAAALKERLDIEARRFETMRAEEERKRREELGQQAEAVLDRFRRRSDELLKAVEDVRERRRVVRERARRESELRREIAGEMRRRGVGAEPGALEEDLRPGMRVLVAPLGKTGIVEESDGRRAVVRIGTARTRVELSDCRRAEAEKEGPPALPSGVSASLSSHEDVSGEILLIGMRVDEALARLDKFLDTAFLAGRSEVRVVHGHGSGRLREAVRRFLSEHPQVASHRPGAAAEGGPGATVALLRS